MCWFETSACSLDSDKVCNILINAKGLWYRLPVPFLSLIPYQDTLSWQIGWSNGFQAANLWLQYTTSKGALSRAFIRQAKAKWVVGGSWIWTEFTTTMSIKSTIEPSHIFGLWSAIGLGWLTLNAFGTLSFIIVVGLPAGGIPVILYGL